MHHYERGSTVSESPRLLVLRLKLEDLQHEHERLRDARSGITKQLGPLPISAALVAGLVSGFATDGKAHLNHALTIGALGAFGLMVFVSMVASVLKPYRKLREKAEKKLDKPSGAKSATEWYNRMIAIEQEVRRTSNRPSGFVAQFVRHVPFPLPWRATDLQTACDLEWKWLFITKTLFVAVIALLILARILS